MSYFIQLLKDALDGKPPTPYHEYTNLFDMARALARVLMGSGEASKISEGEMLYNAPGVQDVLAAGVFVKEGIISREQAQALDSIISKLVFLFIDSCCRQDEMALNQVEAIKRLLKPDTHQLNRTAIKEFVRAHYTRPQLARGWELRELMSTLSLAVESASSSENILKGPVRLSTQCDTESEAYKQASKYLSPASAFYNPRATLQSLACQIYLKQLQDQGFDEGGNITIGTLGRDLQEAKKFEQGINTQQRHSPGAVIWNGQGPLLHLHVQEYSDEWKRRRAIPKRLGKKKPKGSQVSRKGSKLS